MLNLLYILINMIPLPLWFLMIFLPNRDFTRRAANSYTVFVVLGTLYVFTLVGAILSEIPHATMYGTPMEVTTIEGLASLLANPAVALVVWLHMLTLDMLGGYWIYNTSRRLGTSTLLRSISLILAFLFGPLGVLVFVVSLGRPVVRREADRWQQDQPAG